METAQSVIIEGLRGQDDTLLTVMGRQISRSGARQQMLIRYYRPITAWICQLRTYRQILELLLLQYIFMIMRAVDINKLGRHRCILYHNQASYSHTVVRQWHFVFSYFVTSPAVVCKQYMTYVVCVVLLIKMTEVFAASLMLCSICLCTTCCASHCELTF